MVKLLQAIFFVSVLQVGLHAQNKYKDAIMQAANKTTKAQQLLDIEGYMDLMHPKIIEMGGGKDLMRDIISSQIKTYSQMGVSIEGVKFEEPSEFVQAGNEIHCTISGQLELKLGEDTFENPVNYLAASQDDGANWTFIDLSLYDVNSLKLYLPDFNEKLMLPSN